MTSSARVSVVMPAFNAQDTIAASVHSVLGQTHGDVELLVVDDCSTDDTWSIAVAIATSDPRVVPIRHAVNGGVATARNTAIERATGAYVAFLDSDDRWHPAKLEMQLDAMRTSDARVCYTGYRRVDAGYRELSTVRPPASVDHRAMLRSNWIGNLTGLYDRRIGDGRFIGMGHEDYVFWLAQVKKAGKAIRAGGGMPLADYLVRAGSLSADKFRAARWQWDIYTRIEGMGYAAAAWYFGQYAYHSLRKRM